MRRRPNREDLHKGQAVGSSTTEATNDGMRMARLSMGRRMTFVTFALILFNILFGTAVMLRDVLVRHRTTVFQAMWLPQCALVLYALFGSSKFNPLRFVVSPPAIDRHLRKLVLFIYIKCLLFGTVTAVALANRLFLQSGHFVQRHGLVVAITHNIISMQSVLLWQMFLLCAMTAGITHNVYYDLLFPPSVVSKDQEATTTITTNGNGTVHRKDVNVSCLAITASPTTTTTTTTTTTEKPSRELQQVHYYYCPSVVQAQHFAATQPAFLLLLYCPLTAAELRFLCHVVNTQRRYGSIDLLCKMFTERAARTIKKRAPDHFKHVCAAETALAALDSSHDFRESEIARMAQSSNKGHSSGIERDLAALVRAGNVTLCTENDLNDQMHYKRQMASAFFSANAQQQQCQA